MWTDTQVYEAVRYIMPDLVDQVTRLLYGDFAHGEMTDGSLTSIRLLLGSDPSLSVSKQVIYYERRALGCNIY